MSWPIAARWGGERGVACPAAHRTAAAAAAAAPAILEILRAHRLQAAPKPTKTKEPRYDPDANGGMNKGYKDGGGLRSSGPAFPYREDSIAAGAASCATTLEERDVNEAGELLNATHGQTRGAEHVTAAASHAAKVANTDYDARDAKHSARLESKDKAWRKDPNAMLRLIAEEDGVEGRLDDLEEALQLDTSNSKRAAKVHTAAAKLANSVRGSTANLVHWESRLNFLSVVRNVSSPPSVARHLPTLVVQTLFPHPHLVLVQYHAIGIEDSCTSTTGRLMAAYSQDARFKTMIKTIKEILAPSTDS